MKIILLFMFGLSASLSAQNSKCHNIYVWEFTDEGNEKNIYTRDLTNSVEEALVNINTCNVLQRRKFASLQAQVLNESDVQTVRDIKLNISQSLSMNGAELVLFGTLNTIGKKEYELQLRIESLTTTKILRMKSIDLTIEDLVENSKKKALIEGLVRDLVGAEKEKDETKLSPIGSYEKGNLRFELLTCEQSGSTITITAKVVNQNNDSKLSVNFNGRYSRIITYQGVEFPLTEAKLADKLGTNEVQWVEKDLFKGVPIVITLTFNNVGHDINKLARLQIYGSHENDRFQLDIPNILVK